MAKKGDPQKQGQAPEAKDPAGLLPKGYEEFLGQLKERIRAAQLKASVSVNRELVLLYREIGRGILRRQKQFGWGAKIIDRAAADLRREFPGVEGFSPRNLKYMGAFARAWPDETIVQQLAAQVPWFHNCVLRDKVKDPSGREWYVRKSAESGWSRSVLVHWIESDLYKRQGKAQTNFAQTLPAPESDLARETLKDPYTFEFLSLGSEAAERELEEGLLAHIRRRVLRDVLAPLVSGRDHDPDAVDEPDAPSLAVPPLIIRHDTA